MKKNIYQKGISSFVAISIMLTILLMAFGLFSILNSQLRVNEKIGKSVVAFHAADSGIERLLAAIYGYNYYHYVDYGNCIDYNISPTVVKKICDYTNCQPLVTENDTLNCGLPSMCSSDSDCLCPNDKCVGYNYYDYPNQGNCSSGKCINCKPTVDVNSPACGYDPLTLPECSSNSDCPCPVSRCVGLDLSRFSGLTPYSGTLPNGATFKTYILSPKKIKSIGEYKGVKRAIEVSF